MAERTPEEIEAARKLFAGPCEFVAGAAPLDFLFGVFPPPHPPDQLLRLGEQALPGRPAGLRLRPGVAVDEGDLARPRLGLFARPSDLEAGLPADRCAARRE